VQHDEYNRCDFGFVSGALLRQLSADHRKWINVQDNCLVCTEDALNSRWRCDQRIAGTPLQEVVNNIRQFF
jgi:hypothetical protein